MKYIIDISIIVTLIIAIISNHYANNIKRLSEIKPISSIMQIDALFDMLVWIYKYEHNVKSILLIYSLTFPVNVILNGLIPSFRNTLYFFFVLILNLVVFYTIDYASLRESDGIYFLPCVILQLLAIMVCSYKVLKHKRILQPVNYLFYLMLGFLILDFFWFLGFQKFIINKYNSFWNYHRFYTVYLVVFRIIYIYYVVKFLWSSWITNQRKSIDF